MRMSAKSDNNCIKIDKALTFVKDDDMEDDDTEDIDYVEGYIINWISKDFPVTITGVENKEDFKKEFMQIISDMFDKAVVDYEAMKEKRCVYQFGEIS
jgi:hypothetical protein